MLTWHGGRYCMDEPRSWMRGYIKNHHDICKNMPNFRSKNIRDQITTFAFCWEDDWCRGWNDILPYRMRSLEVLAFSRYLQLKLKLATFCRESELHWYDFSIVIFGYKLENYLGWNVLNIWVVRGQKFCLKVKIKFLFSCSVALYSTLVKVINGVRGIVTLSTVLHVKSAWRVCSGSSSLR